MQAANPAEAEAVFPLKSSDEAAAVAEEEGEEEEEEEEEDEEDEARRLWLLLVGACIGGEWNMEPPRLDPGEVPSSWDI